MTRSLAVASREVRGLSAAAQDALAASIVDQITDDRRWEEAFARSQEQLARLADQVRDDIAAGRVRPLRPRAS